MTAKTAYLFVTGGVVSSIGKGVVAASLARLLSAGGEVRAVKIDPYLNVDPGTMAPSQHGEVYVLADGTETDLDLGHYERLGGLDCDRRSSVTMGRVYESVVSGERAGKYAGATVQAVPHVTDEVERRFTAFDGEADVAVVEVGGTVGDIEALPVLEAIRRFADRRDPKTGEPHRKCAFVHVTLLPFIKAAGETKTKPTQHSVEQLRKLGLRPDVLVCRTERPTLAEADRRKLAAATGVAPEAVCELPDLDSVYDVPAFLYATPAPDIVAEKLDALTGLERHLAEAAARRKAAACGPRVRVALVGKYTSHKDAYKSVEEALRHAAWHVGVKLTIDRLDADAVADEDSEATEDICFADGVLVPGGFGVRGLHGKLAACRFARTHGRPYFGICLGMQVAAIEYARNVLGLDADSTEFAPKTPHPVVSTMADQHGKANTGGTMRLGEQQQVCRAGTKTARAYIAGGRATPAPVNAGGAGASGGVYAVERHRHRYEFNGDYAERFEAAGMVVSAVSPDGTLAEAVEIPAHPWFVAVQSHPEFTSRLNAPSPLFVAFLQACLERVTAKRRESDRRFSEGVARL